LVPSDHWEVVEIFENRLDCNADEYLMVNVPASSAASPSKISSGGLAAAAPDHWKLIHI
jgi:hypothetical protein